MEAEGRRGGRGGVVIVADRAAGLANEPVRMSHLMGQKQMILHAEAGARLALPQTFRFATWLITLTATEVC